MPDIAYAFLADAAQTIPGQKFNLLGGGISRIGARGFPFRHPHLALVVGLRVTATETDRSHEVRLLVLDPDGAEIASATATIAMQKRPDVRDEVLTFAVDLWNLTFPTGGDHSVRIMVNGSERERLPLLLTIVTGEGPDGAAAERRLDA
ncbi:MAG: hypothetical protein AABZ33_07765 [Chloroflexota bacterium]